MLYISVLYVVHQCVVCCTPVCYRPTPECAVHQRVVGLHKSMLYNSVLYAVHQCVVGLHKSMLYNSVLYAVHQCVVGLHKSVLCTSVL